MPATAAEAAATAADSEAEEVQSSGSGSGGGSVLEAESEWQLTPQCSGGRLLIQPKPTPRVRLIVDSHRAGLQPPQTPMTAIRDDGCVTCVSNVSASELVLHQHSDER